MRTAAKTQQQPKLIPQSANFEQVFAEEASRPGRGKLMLSGGTLSLSYGTISERVM